MYCFQSSVNLAAVLGLKTERFLFSVWNRYDRLPTYWDAFVRYIVAKNRERSAAAAAAAAASKTDDDDATALESWAAATLVRAHKDASVGRFALATT